MCILCVVQRWPRRVAAMLPWLVIPFITLWAISQLLPPYLRLEFTSPRMACVFVLLVTLFWYEILMPKLSVWRARRSARLREMHLARVLELQKLRKAATRRCRNCRMVYRDQNPYGGRFMCSYCGHVSKRPVLDLPGGPTGSPGILGDLVGKNGWICSSQDWPVEVGGNWVVGAVPKHWGSSDGELCSDNENSYLQVLTFGHKLRAWSLVILRWILGKIFQIGYARDSGLLDGNNRGSSRRGENGGSFQENKGEKARKKAEEKRQARLDREMTENEERKQKEEVARLVEEQRKLRDEVLAAEQPKGDTQSNDGDKRKECFRKRCDKKKEKDKTSSKSNSDAEEFDKAIASKEMERKSEFDKKYERHQSQKLLDDKPKPYLSPYVSNFAKMKLNKQKGYLDRVKGSFLSSSKGFNGASFLGRSSRGFVPNAGKASRPSSHSIENVNNRSDASATAPVAWRSTTSVDNRVANSNFVPAVGSEVRPQIPAPKKSWLKLFSHSSDDMNTSNHLHQDSKLDQAPQLSECKNETDLPSCPFDDPGSFWKPTPMPLNAPSPFCNSVFGSTVSHSAMDSSTFREPGNIPAIEETDIFEDAHLDPDSLSFLGSFSDSLDGFSLEAGAAFIGPADGSKPSPIESPFSRARVSEEKHATSGQSPCTPRSIDDLSETNEPTTWPMWGSPLSLDTSGLSVGPFNWLVSQGQNNGRQEIKVNIPQPNITPSKIAMENLFLSGINSHNVPVVNFQDDRAISPIGSGIKENGTWIPENFELPLIGRGNPFMPLKAAACHIADSGSLFIGANSLDETNTVNAQLPLPNCLSKIVAPSSKIPSSVPDSGSLFSCGPDVLTLYKDLDKPQ